MAIKESGIKLVARNAQNFFRSLRTANNLYSQVERALLRVESRLKSVETQAMRTGKQLGEAGRGAAANYSEIAKAAGMAGTSISKIGDAGRAAGRGVREGVAPIEGSIDELRQNFRNARRELESLARTDPEFDQRQREVQGLNSELRDYRRAISGSRRDTDSASDSFFALNKRLGEARAAFKNLSAEERNGDVGVRLRRNIQQLDTQLKSIDRSLGLNQRNVGNYQSALEGLGLSFPTVGQAGAAAFALLVEGARRFAADSLAEFETFENSLAEVFTLLPHLSEDGLNEVEQQVRELSVEIGRTTDETVPALYQALSAGIPEDNVFDFLRVANQAAIGGATDLQNTVGLLSGSVNAYGDDVLTVTEASDNLFTTVRLGTTTIPELASALSSVTPIAGELGIQFSELSAQIATITSVTQNTSEATTQLNALYNDLNREASRVALTFERVAGVSFGDFIANGGTVQEALQLLEGEAMRTETTINNLFGSVEAGQAALLLTGSATERYTNNLREFESSAGATEQAAERLEDTLVRQRAEYDSARESLQLLIGESLAPAREAYFRLGTAIFEDIERTQRFSQANDNLRDILIDLGVDVQNAAFEFQVANTRAREAGITYEELALVVKEVGREFNGTSQELLDLALATAMSRAEAQRSSDRWTATAQAYQAAAEAAEENANANVNLSERINLVTNRSEALLQAGASLRADQRRSAAQAERFAAVNRDLAASLREIGAASVQNVSADVSDIFAASRRVGGGGAPPRDVVGEELERREEQIADLRDRLDEENTTREKERDDALEEERVAAEKRVAEIRDAGQQQAAERERELAAERIAAIEEFNRVQAQGFLDNVQRIRDEDRATPESRRDEALRGLADLGVSAETVAGVGVRTGAITPEEAADALQDTIAQNAIASINQALADGLIDEDQYAEALAELERQLAEGITEIVLPFDIQIQSAATIAAEFATRTANEIRDIHTETQRLVSEAEIESANRAAAIRLAAQAEADAAALATQQRINEIRQEALPEPQQAAGGGTGTQQPTAERRQQEAIVLGLLDEARVADSIEAQRQLRQEALDLGVAFGVLTQAQADNLEQQAELEIQVGRLFEMEEILNEAIRDGETVANNQAQALTLLNQGYIDTAEQAAALAGTLTSQQVAAFVAARQAGLGVEEALQQVGIAIDELPEETQIAILGDDSDAQEAIERVSDALDALPRQIDIAINAQESGAPVVGGTQAAPDSNRPTGLNQGGRYQAGRPYVVGDLPNGGLTNVSELIVPDSSGLVVSNDQLRTAINVLSANTNMLGTFAPDGISANTLSTNISTTNETNNIDNSVRNIDNSRRVTLNAQYATGSGITDEHDLALLVNI